MKRGAFLGAIFLATGTMIGVGLLAVPILTGMLGFFPGLAVTVLAALMMWFSGSLIVERILARRIEDGDIASLYAADLGSWVRWITTPVYLLLFYMILVAYLTAASGIFAELVTWSLPVRIWTLVVFVCFSMFIVFGQSVMLRCNGVIVALVMICFGLMLVVSLGHVRAELLAHVNLSLLPFSLPVLCCAFTYHNVIPFICRHLDYERRYIHLALGLSMLLALMMTAVWLLVVAGTLPYAAEGAEPSLINSYNKGIPATVPLSQVTGSLFISYSAIGFSLLALLTSYLGVGVALSSFFRDVCAFLRPPERSVLLFAVVFLPPLILALSKPDIFLDMVDMAGGFGVIILFGLLPVAAVIRHHSKRRSPLMVALVFTFLFFIIVFLIEAGKVLHLIVPNIG